MKMNVNEACTLAKKIDMWKRELSYLLIRKEYVFDITENHRKSLADESKVDEVIENGVEKKYDVTVDEICTVVEKLISEKTRLSGLIENTKANLTVEVNGVTMTVDAAVEYNKGIREFAETLSSLTRNKDSVEKSTARDYRLDVEGKQTIYVYPLETTYKLTFDKKEMDAKKRELMKLADKNSVEIDKARINSEVEFDTVLEVTDSIEEVIEKMLGK